MVFWIIAAVVVLVGFALAWCTSGGAGRLPRRNANGDLGQDQARLQANIHRNHANGGSWGGTS